MTSLSAQQRQQLCAATRLAAHAFVGDMEYVRSVIRRIDTNRGELRRLSAVLRRLLVEGDLAKIAAPRIGRLKLLAPDNKPIYVPPPDIRVLFFASGGATVFGVPIKQMMFLNAGPAWKVPEAHVRDVTHRLLNGYDFERRIELKVDNFVAQRVLCFNHNWATRGAAIRFVANVCSGVHSGTPDNDEERLMDALRRACSYSIRDGGVSIHVLPQMGKDSLDVRYKAPHELSFTAASLDPELIEMLAAAQYLTDSPDIVRLENAIASEAGSP